jgi:hypothetical protein
MVLTLRIYPTNYRNDGVCKSGIYAQNEWFNYIIIGLCLLLDFSWYLKELKHQKVFSELLVPD